MAVVGACAAAASRLAVAPALGLLSTADALGSYRPDPAVQVVAGVWTMTGVNVEDALANGDVIAAAIADVAGVAASQVVIDGVTQADRRRLRRLDDAQALLNVAYRITGLTEAKATSAARRMDRAPDPVFDAALGTAAAEAGPFETIVFEAAETTRVSDNPLLDGLVGLLVRGALLGQARGARPGLGALDGVDARVALAPEAAVHGGQARRSSSSSL